MKNLKIIAEIGSNWNGNEKLGKKIIKSVKLAGADYVKFQMWRASELYKRTDPNWKMIKKSELSSSLVKKLKEHADKLKIGFFCSVFYPEAVDHLEDLNVKLYKIASWTAAFRHKNALSTLERIAKTKKPVIISMGYGGNINSIKRILKNNKKYFMYCVAKYPTSLHQINFNTMKKYDGFSDHTIGYAAPIIFAYNNRNSKQIKFLEKHISIEDSKGPDSPFSMNINDFRIMNMEIKKIYSHY